MKYKKILATLLSLALAVGCLPVTVLADEIPDEVLEEVSEELSSEDVEEIDETEEVDETIVEEPADEEGSVEEVVPSPAPAYDDIYYENIVPVHSDEDFGELVNGLYELEDNTCYAVCESVVTEGRLHVGYGKNVVVALQGYAIICDGSDGVFGVEEGAVLEVTNGTVKGGNRDGNGGGFNVNGALILEDVKVENNTCTSAGGGIYVRNTNASASVTFKGHCVVTGNSAGTMGGGIYIGEGGSLNLEGSLQVYENTNTNLYLDRGRKINVTDTIDPNTYIGITHVDEGYSDFTVGYADYNNGINPQDIFFGDGSNKIVWADNDEVRSGYEFVRRSWDADSKAVVEEKFTVSSFESFDRLNLSSDDTIDLQSNVWYVVNNDKTFPDKVVRSRGNANILLCDGKTLTCNKGILVEEGYSVSIFGQENNKGAIVAQGDYESAGIGGGNETSAGAIIIHGGTITATGDEFGSGIGGGDESIANVTIYGGIVNATGGPYSPGIGSGQGTSDLGTISIWGGTVTATGGNNGAGIGGSADYPYQSSHLLSGRIEIGGGTVIAHGTAHGAGIGGGSSADVTIDIVISGGTVDAEAGANTLQGGAGIGGGGYQGAGGGFYGTITISGGTVSAFGGLEAAGIGGSYTRNLSGTVTISGGTVTAIGAKGGAAIGGGSASSNGTGYVTGQLTGTVDITGGKVILGRTGKVAQPCALIGKGSGNVDSVLGTILLGDDLCVHFEGYDPELAKNRISTCRDESCDTNARLIIEPCWHSDPQHTTYTDNGETHTPHCRYCYAELPPEEHNYMFGECTVCGHKMADRLAGYSLSLSNDIGVNFYMELADDTAASSNAYVLFTLPDDTTQKVYVNPQTDISLPYAYVGTINDKTYYVFKCNVSAKDIDHEISAKLYDGDRATTIYRFTVKEYAEYLISHPSDPEFAGALDLAKALLNYGAYAQIHFYMKSNLSPDASAISGVTIGDEYKYDPSHTDFPSEYGSFIGASLSLKSETTLSIYIESDRAIDSCVCERTDEYGIRQYGCQITSSGNYQIVRIRDIAANDLDKELTLYLTLNGEPVHISYRPMTYCYTVVNGNYDTDLQNVCKALYNFWKEAVAYSNIH